MKTQIIQLEIHDDVISTRDKIGAGQASRILLVWPAKAHLLTRQIDLVLLQRHSQSLGAQLGLVTKDADVRFFAKELDIPTFKNLRQAQEYRWRVSRRRRWRFKKPADRITPAFTQKPVPRQTINILERPIIRWSAFILSIGCIVILIAMLFPGATIFIEPHQEQKSVSLNVTANPAIKEPLLAGELPVQRAMVIVEGRDALPASGKIDIPEKPALGEVVFTNLTQETVNIPSGSIVSTLETPAIRFATTKAGIVRAGIGQQTTVPILAIVPGTSGNLVANRLQAFEGALGLKLSVDNPEPIRQGTDRPATSPTLADRQKLYNRLLDNLTQTAQQELEIRMPVNGEITDFPLIPTLHLNRVLEETYSPAADQPADQVSLLLRLEFDYQLVLASDLQKLASPIMAAGVREGFEIVPGSLRLQHGQVRIDPSGLASWQLKLSQETMSTIIPTKAAQIAHGFPVGHAKKLLKNELKLETPPNIVISPSWWPYLPFLPFRIKVAFQAAGQ